MFGMQRIITLLLILLSFPLLGQTGFYVDPVTGSDLNDGLTPATAWASIQKACNSAVPNSVVYIKGGVYHENIQVNVSGTNGNPITFTNLDANPVIVDGTGTTGTSLLRISNKSWLHFQNMAFRNLVRNNARGIMVETTQNGYSRNISFTNISIHGIRWTDQDDVVPATGQNARGFAAVGRGNGIEYLSLVDCTIHDNVTGKSEALTLNGNIEDFLIEGCTVHDNTNIGISLAGNYGICNDPALDKARNGIVRGNTCYNNVSLLASSAGIYVDGGENIVIERNSCYQNGTGISVGCEKNGITQFITVKNNLIYNNWGRGIAVGGYTLLTNGQVLFSTVRNNTLYQNNFENLFASEIHVSKASNCVFEDNIIYTGAQNIVMAVEAKFPQADNLFNFNCIYTPSGDADDINIYWHDLSFDNLEQFQQSLGQELNTIFADPQCTATSPAAGSSSQCINAGNPNLVVEAGELDFTGNPRLSGQAVDIGAFEINLLQSVDHFIGRKGLSPNPVSGSSVEAPLDLADASITMYDSSGRRVAQIRNVSGRIIRLPSLPDGIYVYHISQGGNRILNGRLAFRQ